GYRGQRHESFQVRQLILEFPNDLFQQKVAEGDSMQSRLAVTDTEKGRGADRFRRITGIFRERDVLAGFRNTLGQRHFHEYQGIVAQSRMKECETTAVPRVQAAAQI